MTVVLIGQRLAASTDGDLAEIFLDTGKPDATIQMHADDAAVLVSLLLQNDVSPDTIDRSISGPISRLRCKSGLRGGKE